MASDKIILEGHCSKGYEPVKEEVLRMLRKGVEENLQLCVYVGKECVLDLCGTNVGDTSYTRDTVQVNHIFRSGQCLAVGHTATDKL